MLYDSFQLFDGNFYFLNKNTFDILYVKKNFNTFFI